MSSVLRQHSRRDESVHGIGLFAARTRIGLWVIIASNALFALTDLRLAGSHLAYVYGLKIIGIGAAVAALRILGRLTTRRAVLAVVIAIAAITCVLVAVSGAISGDDATTMILCLAFAWGTSAILPIGMGPQSAVVAICGLAMLLNVWLVHGDLSEAISYPAVGVVIALGASLCLAYEFERHRRALERESEELLVAQRERRRSEADLQAIFDHLQDVFYRADLDGTLLLVSPSVARYGYRPDELVGCHTATLYRDPEDRARVLPRLLETGALQDLEVTLIRRDGGAVAMSANVQLIYDADQRPVGIEGMLRDIADRKSAEAALRQANDQLEVRVSDQERFVSAVLETVGALVGVVDREGRIIRYNRACERTFGHRFADVSGRRFWELAPVPDEAQRAQIVFERLLDGRWPTTYDTYWFDREGARRSLAWSTTFLRDEHGAIAYVIGTGIDITDRRQAEQRVRRLNAELEQRVRERTAQLEGANAELASFSYSVSHDLRAPLRRLQGFAAALLEDHGGDLHANAHHQLERIQFSVRCMDDLIAALLGLSRVTSGELHTDRVDLSGLAAEIAGELRRAQPDRAVEVIVAPRLEVQGDPRLLRIALENLLNNAWKYTGRHATARIEVGIGDGRSEPTYFVRDDGAGFDMAYADKLFAPFQRLHDPSEFDGTGIGLATVQRIVRRHGGRIWAEAAVDRGATFYFTLGTPAKTPRATRARSQAPDTPAGTGGPAIRASRG